MDSAVSSPSGRSQHPAMVRAAMGGFFLLGGLIALLGGLLPGWLYYLRADLAAAAQYFFAFTLGIFAEAMTRGAILERLGLRRSLGASCLLAGVSLLLLGAPLSPAMLAVPLMLLGFATGMLGAGVGRLMSETLAPRGAANGVSLAGFCFGAGAVSFTALTWAGADALTTPRLVLLLAILPLALAAWYFRRKSPADPILVATPEISWRATGSSAALLLSLALLFQSAAEWSAGGWLALYWIRLLGVSLNTALGGLAFFWAALTAGKLLSPRLLPAASPLRLLAASTGAALFGCVFLLSTAGVGGALVGVLLLGLGLGTLYSLLLAVVARQVPQCQSAFFHGLLPLSLAGGTAGPWLVGQLAQASVIQWAIWAPALGVCMVFLLQSALLLEARWSSLQDLPH